MGTESLGIIGCIFPENGPLEGGIESSFSGTCWGAKGDFRWIFDPYPCIFEVGVPPFSEFICLQVWAQKVLGSSDVYSRRMGPWKVALNQVSAVPAGVLRVNSGGFLTPIPALSKAASTIFRMHMPSGMGRESLGIIGCIFAENGPLEGGIESSFSCTGWGAKGDFRWSFWPQSLHFRREPPTIFGMHMPSGMGTESLWIIGCIFILNGPLEGGIESSFSGTGWGAKGDFRWIFYLNPCIFESGLYHLPNAHALRYRHRKFGDHRMYIRGEWALTKWHWITFQRYRLGGAKGDFRWIFYHNPCIFVSGLQHFPNAHALRYGHRKFGDHRMYIRGEWAFRRWHWIKFQRYQLGC